MNPQPFSIAITDAQIADLRARLENTRWLHPLMRDDWSYGTDFDYLLQLVAYWKTTFDWRKQEARLNAIDQFRITLSGLNVQFIHVRSGRPGAIPLLICHGWPGGINEFEKLVAELSAKSMNAPAFDLVIPSMPGFGFSEAPHGSGVGVHRIADLWVELMDALGYDRFGVQGGDWGGWVGVALSRRAPDRIIGAHLNYVPARYLPPLQAPSTAEERTYVELRQRWSDEEGGYVQIQATKPQTLGFGLTDSPAGLAAWIVEKFRSWSSGGDNPESVFTKDELLTNVSLYWFTSSIFSSTCIYKEARRDIAEADWSGKSPVPVAVAKFPSEIPFPPRSHISKYLNVVRWTEMPKGGHFAAMEAPADLARDIQGFFASL